MNKKIIVGIIFIIIVIAVIGAIYFLTGNNSSENNANQTISSFNETNQTSDEELKTLIVYFSVPETDDPNNMTQDEDNSTVVVNGEVLGNTQYVAQLISEYTNYQYFFRTI